MRSWHLTFLLVVGHGIGSQCKGFTWKRGGLWFGGFCFSSTAGGSIESIGSDKGIGTLGVFQKDPPAPAQQWRT